MFCTEISCGSVIHMYAVLCMCSEVRGDRGLREGRLSELLYGVRQVVYFAFVMFGQSGSDA